MIIHSTSAEFISKVLKSKGETAVLFYDASDPRSVNFLPVWKGQESKSTVNLAQVSLGGQDPLRTRYNLKNLPTVVLFENGHAKRRKEPAEPGSTLSERELLALLR